METIFHRDLIPVGNIRIHTMRYPEFDPKDFLHVLTEVELERFLTFGHVKRQREFIATRFLRHSLFGLEHIHYSEEGAPYIQTDTYISISHSRNVVAIALNDEFPIGLDLEAVRFDIDRVMHKFLSDEELTTFDCSDPVLITSIWSAKETLYKLAGRKQILFSDELHISKDKGVWKGRIINPDHDILVNLDIFERDGIVFTLNTSQVEFIERHS